MTGRSIAAVILTTASVWLGLAMVNTPNATAADGPTTKPVTIVGGHDIGRNDFGRPVTLYAAALKVEPDVFREAFSGVTPAHGGGPTREQAQKNKAALMKVLAPHDVTNERMDEVANFYRFQPHRGELWPTTPAQAYAVIEGGKIKQIVVTEPGAGYCSTPTIKVEGVDGVKFKVTPKLGTDLKTNGGIAAIDVVPGK